MIELEIKGFQSIEKVVLRVEGFTAIVGRSNIGKSAVVRALKCALTNSSGTAFVRHGEHCARKVRGAKSCKCQATVHIRMEGFDLLWEKGDAVNRYTFNGKEYDKPGPGIPDFLVGAGMSPVKIGDSFGSIQIADQFYPIFLLNQSGPAIAEAISDVARLARINTATRLVEKDRKEAIATRKVRVKDAEVLQLRLQGYDQLEEALQRVGDVEQQDCILGEKEGLIDRLSSYELAHRELTAGVDFLSKVEGVEPPPIEPVQEEFKKKIHLLDLAKKLDRRVKDYRAMDWVEKFLASVPDTDPVQELEGKLQKANEWIEKLLGLKERFAQLEKLKGVSALPFDEVTRLQGELAVLNKLIERFDKIQGALQGLTDQEKAADLEEASITEEAKGMGGNLTCPTCEQPFQLGHYHE
jgi:energy-coupling factor transporter ATP-binding protein EcfA2